ncbi:MAG TPA: HPr family phosphocarrier protein [Actinomycetes bacterium]|nr:HPr family phosphocarrier protein [Actinomycetes bacterium]
MAERTVEVASSVGLHARPAALFTQAAAAAGVAVTIGRPGDEPVNAASVLGVLSLGVSHGEQVVLAADGEGADDALQQLVDLLSQDLDAEESAAGS